MKRTMSYIDGDVLFFLPSSEEEYVEYDLGTNFIVGIQVTSTSFRVGSEDEFPVLLYVEYSPEEVPNGVKKVEVEVGCGGSSFTLTYLVYLLTRDGEDYHLHAVHYSIDNGSCYSPYDGYDAYPLRIDTATVGYPFKDEEIQEWMVKKLLELEEEVY